MNGRGRDTGIHNKGQNDRRDSRNKVQLFICASNALFADNFVDRKSLQKYIMKLFGGPITWRANKQDTVTTLSIEAELLALSQIVEEKQLEDLQDSIRVRQKDADEVIVQLTY